MPHHGTSVSPTHPRAPTLTLIPTQQLIPSPNQQQYCISTANRRCRASATKQGRQYYNLFRIRLGTQTCQRECVQSRIRRRPRRSKLEEHILCIQFQGLWRGCVAKFQQFRQRRLYLHHDLPTSGHLGITKTYNQLAFRFYWKGIREYTKAYVESCPRCRASKSLSQTSGGFLRLLSIPSRRWSNISLCFIVGLPRSQDGYDFIFTVVGSLSKPSISARSNLSASDFVELFSDRVVRYRGLPQTSISDRDSRFVSEVWGAFYQHFSIKPSLSSAWHRQTDGQTERANRAIGPMLRTFIQSRKENWTEFLPALELAYNCSPHSATGLSPCEFMTGANPIHPRNLDLVDRFPPTLTPCTTKVFRALVDRAAAHLEQAKLQ